MAYNKIIFENTNTREVREAPIGFSWTVFCFGFFPPLFRGDYKWAVIMFVTAIILVGLPWIIFPFIYNKLYIQDLIKSGFKAKSINSGDIKSVETKLGMQIPAL
jgi:hypothetical protein